MTGLVQSDIDRFWAKVEKTNRCWLWTGGLIGHGYGAFWFGGRNTAAHIVSFMIHKGEIPDGLLVLHTCDVRKCVNPDHIYSGTYQRNTLDAVERKRHRNSRKIQCLRGHPLDHENTYRRPSGDRYCRECHRVANRIQRSSL